MSILTDEYFRLKAKMCRKYRCKNCPLSKHRNSQHLTCSTLERENPEKALEIVKKWNEKTIDMEIVKQWRGMKKEINLCEVDEIDKYIQKHKSCGNCVFYERIFDGYQYYNICIMQNEEKEFNDGEFCKDYKES